MLVKKVELWLRLEMPPPVPVTEHIVQEIKSLYPVDPEPPATISDPISALFLSEVAEAGPIYASENAPVQ